MPVGRLDRQAVPDPAPSARRRGCGPRSPPPRTPGRQAPTCCPSGSRRRSAARGRASPRRAVSWSSSMWSVSAMWPASRSYCSRTSTPCAPSRSSSAARLGGEVFGRSGHGGEATSRSVRVRRMAEWTTRGKTVLITGAARGLGAETARRVAARGANVALVGLEPEELERVAAQCGANAAWFECDVTDVDALERAVAGTVERFGGIDVVMANAGIATGRHGPVDGPRRLRAHDRDQPARGVAHRARGAAARDRARGIRPRDRVARGRGPRARAWPPTRRARPGPRPSRTRCGWR